MRPTTVLASLCVVGLLLPITASLPNESANVLRWMIDLASHWQWLFLAGLVLVTSIALLSDTRWSALLLASPLPWVTAPAPAPEVARFGDALTVASVNVSVGAHDVQPLTD